MTSHLKDTQTQTSWAGLIRRRAVMALAPNVEIVALALALPFAGVLHLCASAL